MENTKKIYKYVISMICLLMVFTTMNSNLLYAQEDEATTYAKGDKLNTVSNIDDNITLNLFNYRTGKNEDVSDANNDGINNGHVLKFRARDSGNSSLMNKYTNTASPQQGIVEDKLDKNGYPVIKKNQESLSYLFDLNPSTTNESKKVYSNMDYLFTKDDNGYYNFDSTKSYAEANTVKKTFSVYENSDLGVFFPFNSYDSLKNRQLPTTKGYHYLAPNNGDHYFGLTMSATFYQPKNGRINGNDMVFEFSGDDDVWVFIDGKLVLDLGGIHDASSGSINFNTGRVKVSGKADTFLNKDEFEDYSQHTIDFFYLERGNYASNCKLKFNLPTIPKNSVIVTKEIETEKGQSVNYGQNIDFEFNIKKQGVNVANTDYTIMSNGINIGEGKTDNDGNFTLRHGQSAVFKDFPANENYEVTEIGASLKGYEIKVNETKVEIKDSQGELADYKKAASSGVVSIGDKPYLTFKNIVKETATLDIKKQLANGEENANKEFAIQLKLNGELYDGTYNIGDSTDIPADNGIIKLKADQTASISGLPYGASFEVQEVLDGTYLPSYEVTGDSYDTISGNYAETEFAYGKIVGDSSVTVTNKKIDIKDDKTSVSVTKTWKNSEKYDLPDSIEVTLYEDIDQNGKVDTTDKVIGKDVLNAENNWNKTWNGLDGNKQYIVEEKYPDGYQQVSVTQSNSVKDIKVVSKDVGVQKSLKYRIGENNLVLAKSNNKYVIWTAVDLNLNNSQKQAVINEINELNLTSKLTTNQVNFVYGSDGVEYTPDKAQGTLSFSGSAWESFSVMTYARNIDVQMVNTLDTDKKTSLTVEKAWVGDNEETRPDSITVELMKNGVETGETATIKADKNGNWTHTFENLDYYGLKDGNYIVNQYSVKETKIGDKIVVDDAGNGYVVTVGETKDQVVTITNKQQLGSLKIIKSIDNADYPLGDPIFTFKITDSHENVYYRTLRFEEGDGYTKETVIEDLPLGTATVEELDTIRYTCTSDITQTAEVVYPDGAEVKYTNKLTNDDDFSHTDVVENFFTVNEDGSVTIEKKLTKNASVTEEKKEVKFNFTESLPEMVLRGKMLLSSVLKGVE